LALGDLAAFYREHIIADETTVIAVTGSNGKTTTKAMIHHVLSESMPGSAAPKSFNNHIGVPLTLLSGNEGDDFLVVEIGSNAPGEVAMLAAMTQPDVAVITSIGEAHLEGFGDLMGVAAEKASIFSALRPRGLAVVNADHPELTELLKGRSPDALCTFGLSSHAEFRVSSISCRLDRTVFELSHCGRVELGIAGAHHATNAAACFAACRRMGLSPVQIVDRLRCFQPVDGRCRVVELDGITLVDDTYNANPSSVSAAIATFSSAVEGRRVMVLGDMGELGPRSAEFHEVVTRRATESGLHVLIGVGPRMTAAINRVVGESVPHCQTVCLGDAAEASDAVPPLLLDGDTVWLKGSRATELDQVVKRIVAEVGRPTAVA
jgi:UDP-N-acetylmuramoyl-tripeptide--D-alanyl-D-alanine ligase